MKGFVDGQGDSRWGFKWTPSPSPNNSTLGQLYDRTPTGQSNLKPASAHDDFCPVTVIIVRIHNVIYNLHSARIQSVPSPLHEVNLLPWERLTTACLKRIYNTLAYITWTRALQLSIFRMKLIDLKTKVGYYFFSLSYWSHYLTQVILETFLSYNFIAYHKAK